MREPIHLSLRQGLALLEQGRLDDARAVFRAVLRQDKRQFDALYFLGAIAMQTNAATELESLQRAGYSVYERLVEFPMWEEYGELVKSDLADLKNLGPAEAGMITAGKFLEKFTSYPYIHLDIAGPAFIDKRDSYRGQGGTGFGVRLLFDFAGKFLILHKRNTDGTSN